MTLPIDQIITGDCLEVMRELEDGCVDLILTDPPYGYSFMGKEWDRAVPSIAVWKECLRVLKPGGWCLVMSAPRQDVLSRMIVNLQDAGFRTDFTSIYWAYASGFPKAQNIGKVIDKRLGLLKTQSHGFNTAGKNYDYKPQDKSYRSDYGYVHSHTSPEAKALDGSYAGFQPKPAVEVILVCMKPLSEKTYVDQALKNRKGITWLDDCRIPHNEDCKIMKKQSEKQLNRDRIIQQAGRWKDVLELKPSGRFPANLTCGSGIDVNIEALLEAKHILA